MLTFSRTKSVADARRVRRLSANRSAHSGDDPWISFAIARAAAVPFVMPHAAKPVATNRSWSSAVRPTKGKPSTLYTSWVDHR